MAPNVVDAERLEEMLRVAPFHRWLGVRLLNLDEEAIEIGVSWREEYVVNPARGYAHGGILAAIVDTTADYAIAAKLGRSVRTIDVRIDYHGAATKGDLTARGRVLRLGRTLSSAEATVYGADGKLVASGRGVYLITADAASI